ncbi:MAG: DUF2795 domain-containing protein [Corynebacteriales bacterium]|nr:DUF2795 domain-containing protein [Mycobacteriales bacterium]
MERQSNLHGPALDEHMKTEGEAEPTEGLVDEARSGTPPGMTPEDVQGRSTLARFLPHSAFPGDKTQLRKAALDSDAPAEVMEAVEFLPKGRTFDNVAAVWEALGGGHEDSTHRS